MLGVMDPTIWSRDGEGDEIEANTMEENDISIIENEGINRFIQETIVSMDESAPLDKIYEGIHDIPLFDIAHKPLYKDSKTSLISTLLLLVNFFF